MVLPPPRVPVQASHRQLQGPSATRPGPNQSGPSINPQVVRPQNNAQNNNGSNTTQPQIPGTGLARAAGSGQIIRPPEGQLGQAVIAGRVLNQPNRKGVTAPASPSRFSKVLNSDDNENVGLPPPGKGFYSARAATMVSETAPGDTVPLNPNFPAFNPHLESPSIRKTPGVDHKSSKPLTKDLKHVPGSSETPIGPVTRTGLGRGSVVNPQLDAARQIGAPGGRAMSPMQNRGSYKPPTIKRTLDAEGANTNRPPLANLPANGAVVGDEGGDIKRQRINT